jgi:hypothetical protein
MFPVHFFILQKCKPQLRGLICKVCSCFFLLLGKFVSAEKEKDKKNTKTLPGFLKRNSTTQNSFIPTLRSSVPIAGKRNYLRNLREEK